MFLHLWNKAIPLINTASITKEGIIPNRGPDWEKDGHESSPGWYSLLGSHRQRTEDHRLDSF